jgi:hypothetical protein
LRSDPLLDPDWEPDWDPLGDLLPDWPDWPDWAWWVLGEICPLPVPVVPALVCCMTLGSLSFEPPGWPLDEPEEELCWALFWLPVFWPLFVWSCWPF